MSIDVQEKATRPQPPEPKDASASEKKVYPPRWKVFAPALTSSLLLYLCYFPVAWNWLAWVAAAPLLCLVRANAPVRRVDLAAWLAGLAFCLPVMQWIRVADNRMYATWLLLALYCSFYFLAFVVITRYLDRKLGLPLVITVPIIWTALEYLRSFFGTGFAWYYLSHTQHDNLPLVQIAGVTGAYGVSFVVAAVNAVLFAWLCHWPAFRTAMGLKEPRTPGTRWWLPVQTAVAAGLVAASLAYGYWRLGQDDFEPGPRVALIQTNIDQRIRNMSSTADAARTMEKHLVGLTNWASTQKPKPDLIAWPETSWPDNWIEVAKDVSPEKVPSDWRRDTAVNEIFARNVARHWGTNVLIGLNTHILGADLRARRYNSALLIDPAAAPGGLYHKVHRVPFGEYVPYRDWMPWMNSFAPYDFDYSITPGTELTRFKLNDYRFGVIICYEDSDPALPLGYVLETDDGPPVDFLVNISNDGWFDGTSQHDEHLAISRFRAIECRRSLVRAVNMGISAVIDPHGRVCRPERYALFNETGKPTNGGGSDELPVGEWPSFKKTSAVLIASVPIDHGTSFYAQWGDWLPTICWILLALGLGRVWWLKLVRGKPNAA